MEIFMAYVTLVGLAALLVWLVFVSLYCLADFIVWLAVLGSWKGRETDNDKLGRAINQEGL